MMSTPCRLCSELVTQSFDCAFQKKALRFHRCVNCGFVFKDQRHLLSFDEEKARYLLHENDLAQEGYRNFLESFISTFLQYLKVGWRGLDFGSGPFPALQTLLQNHGFEVAIHDPFFAPKALESRYGFITVCEVVEHLYEPGQELRKLSQLLEPGGILAVRTSLIPKNLDFCKWHYPNDPTHVGFFSELAVHWMEKNLGYEVLHLDANSFVLRRR